MPLSGEEPICPKFQPNIFDPSRCHDCLRQRHLHTGAGESTEVEPQQKPTTETGGTGAKLDICGGTENGFGSIKGTLLTPIQSQAEERDTSAKEDSDGQSVVSSYCDFNGARLGYQAGSFCILSPDCELYICDGDDDDSTDSCRDQSDYQEFSGSVSAEDEYLPIRHHSIKFGMTRLDPPPHRPNPRVWIDEARSKDRFGRNSGLKEDKEKRESGYFSLGKAAGARSLQNNSPSAPYRHFERGHPIFSFRNIEPKDTVPFRNPNLGVASERLIPEDLDEELPVEIPPPDPYEIAVEVEAQVGPRSPSPTPFKIAESLASNSRKGFSSSYGRRSPSPSFQQSGRFDSSRRGSALQSRSSSPSRGNLPFRRSESTTSLNRYNFDSGSRSQGIEPGTRTSSQGTHARHAESGTLPRNFKSFTSSLRAEASTVSDFRSALRKADGNGSINGRVQPSRSSSPTRRDYNTPGQTFTRKSEVNSSSSHGRGYNSHTSSPSRRTTDTISDNHRSSSPRRNYNTSSQSILGKSESVMSLNGRGHHVRAGSPIREGYDIESQALLRNQMNRNGINNEEDESPTMSPSRQDYDLPSKSTLRKNESIAVNHSRNHDSRSSSSARRGHETPTQYQLRKTDTSSSLRGRSYESRNSSPARRSNEAPSQSLLRKAEGNSSVRNHDSRSSSPSRRSYNAPGQYSLRKAESNSSLISKNNTCNFSPPRRGNNDPPGYSVLRNATNREASHSLQRKSTYSGSKSDANHSSRSWQESSHSNRSSSLSRAASPSRPVTNGGRTSFVTLETPKSTGSSRSGVSRRSTEDHYSSTNNTRFSNHIRSPSPSPHIEMRRHTSSQSSMESSESGQLSMGSTGRNREEYAMMADLPKTKMIHQREGHVHTGQYQNNKPARRQELFKPASHSLTKHPSRDWDDTGDTEKEYSGWQYGGSGYLSRAHSSTSLQVG